MKTFKMSMAALLLGGAAALSAQAAELTLYQHHQFGGNQLTLRGYSPNITNYGFNDQTSSIVVRSGRWQICTDADFKGHCAELVPGDYARLDSQFNDRISSAREIGAYRDRTDAYRNYGRGIIKFFAEPMFRGRAEDLQKDIANFRSFGYNDRASSIIVSEGVWELCSDANYSGHCRRYGPGRYTDLGPGMAGKVSSARLVRLASDAPATMRGGWRPAPQRDDGASRVILFSGEGQRGASLAVSDTMPNLQTARFNDAAASMIVEGGTWLACSDAYFAGHCRVFAPGRYNLRESGLARVVSSLRPAAPEPVGRRWSGRETIELFSTTSFVGESRHYTGDVPDLAQSGFNDRAHSMVVNGGEWELCSDAGFGGSCMTVGPGSYADLGGLSARLSSIRRMR